ncbi:MAG: metallo-beta-lactamase family protein, partial [Labilithrix sp.]|nr:metallo-beta-lactamase family protein [Labilithrix sp.]
LLVELGDRLVLVDTGLGLLDVRYPRSRLSPLFLDLLSRPRLRESDTAVRQLEKLGSRPDDVTDIVLTHLDFDHAGGLDDFPRARVHLLEAERTAAQAQKTFLDRQRYRPRQWSSAIRWHGYEPDGERWFGFEAVRELHGLPPEILLVPLAGHTAGHAGVAIQGANGHWHLHCGDAYFYRGEIDPRRRRCTPGLRIYQWLMDVDRERRLVNQRRLRQLVKAHGDEVKVFCAHDVVELATLRKLARANSRNGRRRVRPFIAMTPGLAGSPR